MITPDTTIAAVLEAHPALVDVLADYHPHFQRLRDPQLRKVMAPRVTVAEAARIAGVRPDELLRVLRRAVGDTSASPVTAERGGVEGQGRVLHRAIDPRPLPSPPPPTGPEVLLDVREDIAQGREPFAAIMAAVKNLAPDAVLVLRVPFEPIPLYSILAQRGFDHWAVQHGPGDWTVRFARGSAAAPAGAPAAPDSAAGRAAAAPPSGSARKRITLDVRDLEPPLPMVRVLERLDALAPGEELEVLLNRRPMLLYPQLEERGFLHETAEVEPGLVRIVIRGSAPGPRPGAG